jgi:hypothetical protein
VLGFAGAYGILTPDRPAMQGFDTEKSGEQRQLRHQGQYQR